MRQLSLVPIIVIALSAVAVCPSLAADTSDGSSMDTLSAYLHARHLPLVEARQLTDDSGHESVLLYGFVATDLGKRDAEDDARDYLDDPDITITNQIKVRPELLTLGRSGSGPDASSEVPDDLASTPEDSSAQMASQTQDFPDQVGNIQDYANQEQQDEYLLSTGSLSGGLPLAMVIIGSGAIFPPLGPPVIYGPHWYGFPPYRYPGFGMPPQRVTVFNPSPFGGFPSPPGPLAVYPPAFPAGPTPRFPATGGYPPSFGRTIGPAFGGFSSGFHGGFHGFSGSGFGGGRR
jgi:hypothetical protein